MSKIEDELVTQAKHLGESIVQFKNKLFTLEHEIQEKNARLKSKVIELDIITEYLHSVLDHISQGILFIDSTGLITTFNKNAEIILKRQANSLLFRTVWDFFSDNVFGFSIQDALRTFEAPSLTYAEFEGVEIEIHTSFVSHKGIIISLRDITEMKHLQLIAHRNDRMKELGEMAAIVAHEIRNPLGGIKGFASLLQRDLVDQPHLKDMSTAIVEGADHLNRLVSNVLNYARPFQIFPQVVNMKTLLLNVVEMLESDNSIPSSVKITVFPQNCDAVVDPGLMKGAFFNLIYNSIQAMPNGGYIQITLQQTKKDLLILFADTGIGINKDDIKNIFMPFFTTKENGNGFGLAEVRKIIEAHGGEISIDKTDQTGTVFAVRLPMTPKG